MATKYTNNYDIFFETLDEGMDALDHVRDIARRQGSVSLADIKLVAGVMSHYGDTKTYWVYDDLRHVGVAKLSKGYGMMLPAPSSSRCIYRPTSKPTPKPLTINVYVNNVDDPDNVLAKAFQYAQTIVDREVMLNIS